MKSNCLKAKYQQNSQIPSENNMNGQSNTSVSGIWLFLGLLALAGVSYIIYMLIKHKPDKDEISEDRTSQVVSEYLKNYYLQIRNQLNRSYNLMYSLSLSVDNKLPDPIRITDLRDLGLDYESVKKNGYPYVSILVNSENHFDWNLNLNKAHSIINKMAEKYVIENVLSDCLSSLELKVQDELRDKSVKLSRECDLYPRIKDLLTGI